MEQNIKELSRLLTQKLDTYEFELGACMVMNKIDLSELAEFSRRVERLQEAMDKIFDEYQGD